MILIIDVHNLAHRASHAYSKLWSEQSGIFTGLYYGVLHLLERYVDELQPDMVWLVSDPIDPEHKRIWRRDIYAEYKNRAPKRDEDKQRLYSAIQNQLVAMRQALLCTNCAWMEQAHLEADDIIGWLCHTFATTHKIVVSTDRDLLQLVDEFTSIYYPGQPQRWFHRENFREQSRTLFPDNKKLAFADQFSVSPDEWFEYRRLTGDDSDTITGLPKCGTKTAKEIIVAGGYDAWARQAASEKKITKTNKMLISDEARAIYERNNILMSLKPPKSPVEFDMSNPLCRLGVAAPDSLIHWLEQMNFSGKEGSVISKLQRSPLLKKLSHPYASLRSW